MTLGVHGIYSSGAIALQTRKEPGGTGPLSLGIAGYTFHSVPLDQCIPMMQQVGVDALSIKDFYLPLNSSTEKIGEVLGKFRAAGISIYAAGVIYMKSESEVDQAFDYARRIGVPLIIGVPNFELLPYVERKTKSEGIRIAIHNHGPEDKLYPGPKEVYDRIRSMDSRIGLCLDVGHAIRAGEDPVGAIGLYGDRIMDLHIKDLAQNSPEERSVPVGRGILDIPGIARALYAIKFPGRCSIEYEVNEKDILPGLAESVGYFRGVAKALS